MRQQLIIPLLLAVMSIGIYQPAIAQTPPEILWQHNYGGSSSEAGRKISPTNDGGYIVTARTQSNDGDVTGYYGLTDIWVIKLNALGELEWQRCMGGSDQEWNEAVIRQTSDGGYILGAYTNSTDGDVECSSQELSTIWVTKLDVLGNVLWNSCFGGSDQDRFSDLLSLPDGYLICGSTLSTDGEGLGNHGMQDVLLIRIDLEGNKLWSRCYGGNKSDLGHGLIETTDGNFIFSAITRSIDGDLDGQNPYNPVAATGTTGWLVKVDGDGNVLWQRCIGGFSNDVLISVNESSDGSFIAVGNSSSVDGDIPLNRGGADAWIIKVGAAGDLEVVYPIRTGLDQM